MDLTLFTTGMIVCLLKYVVVYLVEVAYIIYSSLRLFFILLEAVKEMEMSASLHIRKDCLSFLFWDVPKCHVTFLLWLYFSFNFDHMYIYRLFPCSPLHVIANLCKSFLLAEKQLVDPFVWLRSGCGL